MTFHVIFTPDGIPSWIGFHAAEGSEEVEAESLEFLIQHMRTPEGKWVPRPPPIPPTAEEVAAMEAELARQAEEAAAQAQQEIEREIAWRLGPDIALRSMGKITIAELTKRETVIRAAVLAGN